MNSSIVIMVGVCFIFVTYVSPQIVPKMGNNPNEVVTQKGYQPTSHPSYMHQSIPCVNDRKVIQSNNKTFQGTFYVYFHLPIRVGYLGQYLALFDRIPQFDGRDENP